VPEVRTMEDAAVVFISTEIGRGHPSYLDGLADMLRSDHPHIPFFRGDVFALSKGVSLAAWKSVRRMYRVGGRGGAVSSAYGRLRKATGAAQGKGATSRVLGRDVRRSLSSFSGLIVAAHPLVAGILASDHDVIYQHGELAAPPESFVTGCRKIFVPLEETAECFLRAGFSDDDLLVTGQCIETDLVALAPGAFRERVSRLDSNRPLTAALFSSGAYPRDHIALLERAAVLLIRAGHTVHLFAGQSPRMTSDFAKNIAGDLTAGAVDQSAEDKLHIIHTRNRADENRTVADIFERLDLFIAPAHERTNWAVGLGLPQIILTPHIGSYAPLNARFALERQVAVEIDYSKKIPSAAEIITDLRRDGRLKAMAENGFGKNPIDGFARAARFIADNCPEKK